MTVMLWTAQIRVGDQVLRIGETNVVGKYLYRMYVMGVRTFGGLVVVGISKKNLTTMCMYVCMYGVLWDVLCVCVCVCVCVPSYTCVFMHVGYVMC
jgi:hypothetical protein